MGFILTFHEQTREAGVGYVVKMEIATAPLRGKKGKARIDHVRVHARIAPAGIGVRHMMKLVTERHRGFRRKK